MILLHDILQLDDLVKQGGVLLVRHSHKHLVEMENNLLIEEYQSFQSRPAFLRNKYIVSFLGAEKNTAVFYGLFEITDVLQKSDLPKYSPELKKYCNKQNPGRDFYMKLQRLSDFDKYVGRLVIDWLTPRGWYNSFGKVKNKEVVKLLPKNFVKDFPGLMNIKLNFFELKKIINNQESHSEWYNSLTRLQAVYLILDTLTGAQYIGTTYGKMGLWQRWESYAVDGTGGNVELDKLKKQRPDFYNFLQFSVLEVLSKTADQNYCTDKENLWKSKLGSRTHGLNKN